MHPGAPLCGVVVGPTLQEVCQQLQQSSDLFELRCDLFDFDLCSVFTDVKQVAKQPLIITLRSRDQGGGFTGDESTRGEQLCRLAALGPAYIDLEYDVDEALLKEVHGMGVPILSSYHNFVETPRNLPALIEAMPRGYASAYKIATWANSSIDAMRMLDFVRRHGDGRLVGLCMGERGAATRILGPLYGNALTYCTICDAPSTLGQLSQATLRSLYRYGALTRDTAICALIGTRVEISPSHRIHNPIFTALGHNALYLKFQVTEEECMSFIDWARQLRFRGLAVTMPHKEAALTAVTCCDGELAAIGALNTLRFNGDAIYGSNSDGVGALDAIEAQMKVEGKQMVIIGAGGTARAIAFEANKRGAQLAIFNRSVARARALAARYGATYGSLAVIPDDYAILVNTTSVADTLPIDSKFIKTKALVMDVIPGNAATPLLAAAAERGCLTVSGDEMLRLQALAQYKVWFGERVAQAAVPHLQHE